MLKVKEDVCLSLCLYTNCARRSFLEIGLEMILPLSYSDLIYRAKVISK